MKLDVRLLRTLAIWVVALGALAVFAAAAVLESGILTPRIVAFLNEKLGPAGELKLATSSIYWRPWSGLTLNDVHLTIPREYGVPERPRPEPPEHPGFVPDPRSYVASVHHVEIGYRFTGLLFGRPHIRRIKVVRPDLDLAELSRWNARLAEIRGDAAFSADEGLQQRLGRMGVEIDRLQVLEGRVQGAQGPILRRLRLVGSVSAADDVWQVEVENAAGHLTVGRIDEDVEVTGDVTIADGAVRLDALHVAAAGGRVSFEGRLSPWSGGVSDVLTTGYAIPLTRVGSWIGLEHTLLSGDLGFRFLTSGRPDSLELTGTLSGVDETGRDREIQFFATRRGDVLGLSSLRVTTGDSEIDVKGQVVLEETPRVDGSAVFRNVDPAIVLGEPDLARITGVSGTMHFSGRGLTREQFDGTAHVEFTRGDVFGLEIDRASAHVTLKDSEIVLNGARIERGRSMIDGVGSIDPDNQVAAEFTGTVDLADLRGVAEGSGALEGQASAEVHVLGPLLAPSLDAVLRFENAKVLGAHAGKLEVTLLSPRIAEPLALDVEIAGEDIGYVNRVIPRGSARGSYRDGTVTVTNLRLESDKRGELRLTGDLDVSETGDLDGRVNQLEIWSPHRQVRWANEGPIRIERREGALTFTGLDLRAGSGQVTGDVSIVPSGAAVVSASANGVDLSVFSPFLLLPEPLGGLLRLEASAIVSADSLAADIDIDLSEGRYGDDVLDRVRGRIELRDDRVVFDDLDFRTTFATGSVRGEVTSREPFRTILADSTARKRLFEQVEFDRVEVTLDAPELGRFDVTIPVLDWPGGHGTLHAFLDGPSSRPRITYEVTLTDGMLGLVPLTRFEARGSWDGSEITIDDASLASGDGVIRAVGTLPVSWNPAEGKPRFNDELEANLRFQSTSFPVRGLTAVLDFFELTRGRARVDGRLAGRPGHMYQDGDFVVERGSFSIPTFQDPLVDGRVVGRAGPGGIEITSGRFTDARGGQVFGSGRIRTYNFRLLGMDIDVTGNNYHYRGVPGIIGEGSGKLHIGTAPVGDRLVPNLTGSFEVTRADLDERVLVPPDQTGIVTVPEGISIPPESVNLDTGGTMIAPAVLVLAAIDFEADNNVWFRSGGTEIEMAGKVRFHITEDYFGLTGRIQSLRGIYSVLNADFDVDKAEIEFIDPSDPLASYIDAEATARVPDERIRVLVTGPIGDPNFEWITESGLSEAEVYEFLALRVRRSEANGQPIEDQGVINQAFINSLGAFVASRFGREITRELGLDTLDLEVEGASTRVGVGKRLGSDLFVKYTQQVSTDPTREPQTSASDLERFERQLLVEYRLSRIFQLQGETGRFEGTNYLNVDLRAELGY